MGYKLATVSKLNSTVAGIFQGICQKMWNSFSKIRVWKPAALSKINATLDIAISIFETFLYQFLKHCFWLQE